MGHDPEAVIKALIVLLEDEDIKIARVAQENLVDLGPRALTHLKASFQQVPEPSLKARIRFCIDKIQARWVDAQFGLFTCQEDEKLDLERGALLIGRVVDPDLDEERFRSSLDGMVQEIRRRMQGLTDPKAILETVNTVFFGELKFTGNQKDDYEPENSVVHRVLERKTGIAIILSVIYLLIAQRLGLPIDGIGMPGHFLVKYESPEYVIFIDPFNAGQLLNAQECAQFLINLGYGFEPAFLARVGVREVLSRMLRNLISIYATRGDRAMEERFGHYLKLLSEPALTRQP